MRALLTSVSIFFAFLAAGESLTCHHCINRNGTDCSGVPRACDYNATSCEHNLVEFLNGSIKTLMAYKRCSPDKECKGFNFSQSVFDVQVRMKRKCCNTDNCNAGPVVLLPRNSTVNGVICPVCYAENTTTCVANTTMKCTGPETKCMDFGGQLHIFDRLVTAGARYCVNEDPCTSPIFSYRGGPVASVEHYKCSDSEKKPS